MVRIEEMPMTLPLLKPRLRRGSVIDDQDFELCIKVKIALMPHLITI
jgi:hypothetical protein